MFHNSRNRNDDSSKQFFRKIISQNTQGSEQLPFFYADDK